jgi:pilus assembly protein Flp/PilA
MSLSRSSLSQNIKTNIKLPCSILISGAGLTPARGVTEAISRDMLVVMTFSAGHVARLRNSAHLVIAIDLPNSGISGPRVLECAVTVYAVRAMKSGLRISAGVDRMSIRNREPGRAISQSSDAARSGRKVISAIGGSRNMDQMVRRNHITNTTQHQGELSMSFLKNLFVEEDGQDMVEYGLVISLVAIAGAAILTTFKGTISTAFTALGTSVTTNIN